MVTVSAYKGGPSFPIHDEYRALLDKLSPMSERLMNDIWRSPRFRDRFEYRLMKKMFGHSDPASTIEIEGQEILQLMLGDEQDVQFRRLGVAWFAPLIASDLLTRVGRARLGDLTDEECLMAMSHKDHIDASKVQGEPGSAAYQLQGMYCFVAWLQRLDQSNRDHVLLTLPLSAKSPIDYLKMRTAIFESVVDLPKTTKEAQ